MCENYLKTQLETTKLYKLHHGKLLLPYSRHLEYAHFIKSVFAQCQWEAFRAAFECTNTSWTQYSLLLPHWGGATISHVDSVVKYDLTAGDKRTGCQQAMISINYFITYAGLARVNHEKCMQDISHLYSVSVRFSQYLRAYWRENSEIESCHLWAEVHWLWLEGAGIQQALSADLRHTDTCYVKRLHPSAPSHTLYSERQKWHRVTVVISSRPERTSRLQ